MARMSQADRNAARALINSAMARSKTEPDTGFQWEYTTGSIMEACGLCGATVASRHTELHEKWHEELDEVIGSFYAGRLRVIEGDLDD